MKIAKKYHVGDSGLVEGEALGRITVYLAADFERLVDDYAMVGNREHSLRTRIAELEQSEKQAQETATLALRTSTRVAAERDALQLLLNNRDDLDDQLTSLEQRRHAEQRECQAAERRVEALCAFANEMVSAAFEGGSLDGADIQDIAVMHGLLRIETREDECGDGCACREYGFPAECYRRTELIALNPATGVAP